MKINKETRARGHVAFWVLAAAILLYFAMLRIDSVVAALQTVTSALQPLIWGIALAYILRPIEIRIELGFRRWAEKLKNGKRTRVIGNGMRKAAKGLAVFISMVFFLGLVALFLLVVLPQLIDTVRTLIQVLPGQVTRLMDEIEKYTQTTTEAQEIIDNVLSMVETTLTDWVKTDPLGSVMTIVSNVMSFANGFVRLFIALIVAIYLLIGWDRQVAQCKKIFLAISRNDEFNKTAFDTINSMNRIFSGFIVGKLIDSLIIGVITFIAMSIMKMPYTLLISVIIGVTNIIPMFGPFIGAIPSAFLILLVSPNQCITFIIFILILQQIDGNVIGPRILGDSTGISALYVTIAMLLFSKLFGFIGMIIGVPVFATLYYLVKQLAEKQLAKRNLPTDTADYMNSNGIPTPTETPAQERKA